MQRIYTPPAEIEKHLQDTCSHRGAAPEKIQARTVGGHPSVTCLLNGIEYSVATESLIVRFSNGNDIPTFRWIFEPILDTIDIH